MDTFFKSRAGIVLISIVWGLGLATLFKRACKDGNCVVIHGPDPNIIKNNIYSLNKETNSQCVKMEPYIVPCKDEKNIIKDVKKLPYNGYTDDYGYDKYIYHQYNSDYDIAKFKPYDPSSYYSYN